jgi:hypothetical protein
LLVLAAAAPPARADWQVRRTDSTALLDRAERALLERPDDDDVARRLVKLAGRDGRARLRERFRARADRAATTGGRAAYAPLAAYAHLLHALGDPKAACGSPRNPFRPSSAAPARSPTPATTPRRSPHTMRRSSSSIERRRDGT